LFPKFVAKMEGQQHFISLLPWVDFAKFGPIQFTTNSFVKVLENSPIQSDEIHNVDVKDMSKVMLFKPLQQLP